MDEVKGNENNVMELPENELTEMISISVICRLCANQNDKLIGIYSEDGIHNGLAGKMNMYLPVKVDETDVLPLQCCWQCASTVLAWHDLVVTSVEADRRLRSCEFVTTKHLNVEYGNGTAEVPSADEHDSSTEDHVNEKAILAESITSSLNAYCQNETAENSPQMHHDKEYSGEETSSNESKIENKFIAFLPTEFKAEGIEQDEESSQDNHKDATSECGEDFLKENKDSVRGELMIYNFGCQYCPSMFVTEEEIVKHIQDEHPENGVTETESSAEPSSQVTIKKEKRKNNKIDQDLVNAAKVVVDGRIYYNCKQCGKSLHSPYTYVWHMRIHTGERPFVCDLCGKQFRVSQGLVRHLKETHARIKNFPCDLCGRKFATRRNVEEHRRIHTNERPYICDLCGKAFKQKASLFVHNRSHTALFPFKCSYCTQAFRTKPPLLIHITRHTGEKPYPCEVCGRCFRIKYELKRHMLIHSDEKPFSCGECFVSFRQKRYLRNHIKMNHQSHLEQKNKPERIDIEDDNTETPSLDNGFNLSDEDETKTEENKTNLYCPQCQTSFRTKLALTQHTFSHKNTTLTTKETSQVSDEKSSSQSYYDAVNIDTKACNLCDMDFQSKTLLKKHMKDVHNLTEPRHRRKKTEIESKFFCHVCNKGFTRKFDMQKHISKKHPSASKQDQVESKKTQNLDVINSCKVLNAEGNAHYKCDSCDRMFKRSYSLMRHRTIHSGVRPYCCHICGKSFRVSNGLARHINEHHYKVKKYACDICGRKFVSRHTRDEHLNIHSNNRPFICDICGKSFKQAASLHIHKLFHSNIFRFQCNACGKKFRRAQDLKVHKWMHTGEKPYKCRLCNAAFRLSQDLKRHAKVHEKSTECVCSDCGSTFSQERYLKIHRKIHLSCPQDPYEVEHNIGNIESLFLDLQKQKHQKWSQLEQTRMEEDDKELNESQKDLILEPTNENSKYFELERTRETHYKIEEDGDNSEEVETEIVFEELHEESCKAVDNLIESTRSTSSQLVKSGIVEEPQSSSNFMLDSCSADDKQEEDDDSSSVLDSTSTVCESEKYVCEICDKLISTKTNYSSHIRVHIADYYCRICCNSYSSKFKLNLHLSTHNVSIITDQSQSMIQCDFIDCEKLFPSKLQLYNHKKVHSSVVEYQCDTCGLTFVRKSALDAHETKHNVTLSCSICEKVFANKKTLKEHERIHTGELPYECKECGRKFRCHSGLKYHEDSHSAFKKYHCVQCKLNFSRSNYLKDHLRRHLNEKPFNCEICDRTFTQRSVLNRHIRNVHRMCDVCNEIIGNVRDFKAHMYKLHNIRVTECM